MKGKLNFDLIEIDYKNKIISVLIKYKIIKIKAFKR